MEPKKLLELEIEAMRIQLHYRCHIEGLIADNLLADTTGEEIPHNGEEFKSISHTYHNKFEKILKELKDVS